MMLHERERHAFAGFRHLPRANLGTRVAAAETMRATLLSNTPQGVITADLD
jgi:hypothetical protein